MNTIYKIVVGCGIFLYGVFKLILFLLNAFIPLQSQEILIQKFPYLKLFLTQDTSIMGFVFLFALFAYGIYSLLYGLTVLNLLPMEWDKVLKNELLIYLLYTVIGLILILTASLHQETSIENKTLKTTNLISGYMFLGAIPLTYIYMNGFHGADTLNMLLMLGSIAIIGTCVLVTNLF